MSYWPVGTAASLIPLKHAARLNPETLPENTDPEFEFDYIDISSVTFEDGVKHRERVKFKAAPSRARKPVSNNDVIVSTVRTYLRAVALIDESTAASVVSTGFAVLRPRSTIDPKFLYRVCQSNPFVQEVQARSTGVGYPGINPTALGAVKIPVPDLNTQKAVANFLEREMPFIEGLIAKKVKQIALLNQKAKEQVARLVTQGLMGHVPQRPTGLEWLPSIPCHWEQRRVAHLFREVDERGDERLPVLSVSIHTGISDRELDDEERDRKVARMEDRTRYKRVRPGYLAYNMMRAWQGAVGVSTVDGVVSPAYVTARPVSGLHSPYVQFLLRTPVYIEEMRRRSKGIADFRLRLYWDQFRQLPIVLPPHQEQEKIATAADLIFRQSKAAVEAVERSVALLRERRAALITAAVSGQIDVRQKRPAVLAKPDRIRFRVIVGAEIVQRNQGNAKFGRVKLQKELYLAEAHIGISELGGAYIRAAAGPFDSNLIEQSESGMAASGFFETKLPDIHAADGAVTYSALANAGHQRAELDALLGARAASLRRMADELRDFDTHSVEAVATLFAVWNDALIDGTLLDDNKLVHAVLNDWHPEKREKFKPAELHHWLAWMKRNGFVPRGCGPRTISTVSGDLFEQ